MVKVGATFSYAGDIKASIFIDQSVALTYDLRIKAEVIFFDSRPAKKSVGKICHDILNLRDLYKMWSWLSKIILRLWGWEITGFNPRPIAKCVYAVVPHTSNWDFPLGILVRNSLKIKINFVAKKSLFRAPFGWLFRWLGGYAVDRSQRSNYVNSIVEIFNREERFTIAIAPEGTRKKVERLRSGFYHIARLAKVPIILVKFDAGNKQVVFSDPFYPGDDAVADMAEIEAYFRGTQGFNPEWSFT